MTKRRLVVCVVLWLVAPPLGLYHFYLGRDQHGVLHMLSGGGLVFGWLRDGANLARYVASANEEPCRGPARALAPGVWRAAAMIAYGYAFGVVAAHLAPPSLAAPTVGLGSLVLMAAGAAAGVWAVRTVPTSAASTVHASLAGTLAGAKSALQTRTAPAT